MPGRSSTNVLDGKARGAVRADVAEVGVEERPGCGHRPGRAGRPAVGPSGSSCAAADRRSRESRGRRCSADGLAERGQFEVDVADQFLIAFSERTLISRCSHTRSPCGRSGIKKGHFTGSARALLCAVGQPGPIALSSLVHQEGSFSGSLEAQRDRRVHPRGAPGREPACRDSRRQQCARSGRPRQQHIRHVGARDEQ